MHRNSDANGRNTGISRVFHILRQTPSVNSAAESHPTYSAGIVILHVLHRMLLNPSVEHLPLYLSILFVVFHFILAFLPRNARKSFYPCLMLSLICRQFLPSILVKNLFFVQSVTYKFATLEKICRQNANLLLHFLKLYDIICNQKGKCLLLPGNIVSIAQNANSVQCTW